jgi:hypothetical protein
MATHENPLDQEQPLPPRLDLWIAATFFVIGTAAAWLAYRMPTFADQKGEIYTAPGLVPGFYGAVIMVLSIWLGVRAVRQRALQPSEQAEKPGAAKSPLDHRLALAVALMLVFVVGLLGRMPFWLSSAIFVAAFTGIFEWQEGQPWQVRARRLGEAILLGLATGIVVMLVFERFFYVRLP